MVTSDLAVRRRHRTRLVAASVGVAATVVGVLLIRVQALVVFTDGDCSKPLGSTITECRYLGHPFIHLGVFIVTIGLLAAVLFWRAVGGEPSG